MIPTATFIVACLIWGFADGHAGHECANGELRLVNPKDLTNKTAGYVEYCYERRWQHICDDRWDWKKDSNAKLVCRLLRLPYEEATVTLNSAFGAIPGVEFALDDVRCNGSETSLTQCFYAGPGLHNCDSTEIAGVICKGQEVCEEEGMVRIVGSGNIPTTESFGIVEICRNLKWGLICDDEWDNDDAEVVCKQLGHINKVSKAETCMGKEYDITNKLIWLDDVACQGNETSLADCHYSTPHDCDPREAAGIDCDSRDADCVYGGKRYVNGRSFPSVDGCNTCNCRNGDVACTKKACPSKPPDISPEPPYTPTPSKTTAATTRSIRPKPTTTPTPSPTPDACNNDSNARLVKGSKATEGSVQVCIDREWKSVCDDYWSDEDAKVVCRQLGFPYEDARATLRSTFDNENVVYFGMDDVRCAGDEENLLECPHKGEHNCRATERAGVICQDAVRQRRGTQETCSDGEVRLVRGSESNGSVEICFNGTWGSVCNEGWNTESAAVVCRQLTYPAKGAVPTLRSFFGEFLPAFFWLKSVNCSGNESSLYECQVEKVVNDTCHFSERAGVMCVDAPGEYPHTPHHKEDAEYAIEGVAYINGTDINGTVRFVRNDGALSVEVKLRGLTGQHYHWHIHDNPVSGPYSCDEAGGHYDPNDATIDACNYRKECRADPYNCEVGDLNGRFGALTPSGMLNKLDSTGQLTLKDIIDRSVVFHSHGERVCGNISPVYECETGDIDITHKIQAAGTYAGPIRVCKHNEWHNVIDEDWTDIDAAVACRDLNLPHRDAVPIYFNNDELDENIEKRLRDEKIVGVICQDRGDDPPS